MNTTFFYGLRLVAVGVAASLAVVGCTRGIEPPSRKPVALVPLAQSQASLQPIFSTQAISGGRFGRSSRSSDEMLDLQMGVAEDTIIVASSAGVVQAFASGQPAWRVSLDEPIVSGVAFDASSQTALVGTRSGQIVALDGETGAIRWRQTLGASVLTPALIAGNRVLLSANNGILYGLNLQSGAIIWQFSTQKPNISVRGAAKPLRLDANTALFGTADGRIHAVSGDSGRPLWTRRVGVAVGGSDVGRMSDVDGTPLVVGNHLYVTSYSGNLVGFDMATGQVLFAVRDFSSIHPVAHQNGQLVGADSDGMIYGFDATTGERLWQNNALKFRKPSAPVQIGNYVAFGDYEGVVHLFNQAGDIVARTQLAGKGQIVSLQASQNRLYAQSADGQATVWQVQ